MFKAAGLDTISYVPQTTPLAAANWPTLGSMIDAGTRLVTFLDNGGGNASAPYLLDGTPFRISSQVTLTRLT